jgi:hypothetical protein
MEPQQPQCGLLESLGRAVEEVEALESIYGYDEGGFEVVSEAALALARAAVDGGATAEDWQAPRLDIELQLQVEPDEEAAAVPGGRCEAGSTVRLRCGLPPGYPSAASAVVSVSVEGLTRSSQDQLTQRLQAKADELAGEEAVVELVQELQEAAAAALAAELAAATSSGKSGGHAAAAAAAPPRFGRRWIVSHHLKNPTKRSNIVAWARELTLGGLSKPGYPGCVVVEGEAASCDEFWLWLKTRTGNWKNLALRTTNRNLAYKLN